VRARLVDPTTTLAPIADALSAADVTVVNLETAVTERGAPEPKTYTFRVAPVAFYALAAAGVDVVTMANNHAVDYGPEAPADTLAAIEAVPLPVVGIGTNERQAFAPAVIDVPGTTIAVFGATDVPDRTAAAGRPTSSCTCTTARSGWAARQRSSDIVSALAAAAADVVVGSHAHVLLGPGWFGRTYVSYGPRKLRLVHTELSCGSDSRRAHAHGSRRLRRRCLLDADVNRTGRHATRSQRLRWRTSGGRLG
jgi:poly-gamma-glutamate capsule biosynthesis protein CapA/YwtB (metallophosphatase superfamily)